MLPTFLGIGVPKAGTTWLHTLLASHPAVAMPDGRKELRFFSKHFARGLGWYESFFPEDEAARAYRVAGEITPEYLYTEDAAQRVAAAGFVGKLVLVVRHPIERAYSAYAHRVRTDGYRGRFEDFAETFPHEIACGDYGRHVAAYRRHFEREQLLVLVFERLFDDVDATKQALARFLEVDAARFPEKAGHAVVNPTSVPRFRRAFALAQNVLHALRKSRPGSHLLALLRRLGAVKAGRYLLGRQDREDALPSMRPATRRRLARRYAPEVDRLEALTGLDLADWKRSLP